MYYVDNKIKKGNMEENINDIWGNYALLCKIPYSKIPEVMKCLKKCISDNDGCFIIDKTSVYDITLMVNKPTTPAIKERVVSDNE